MKERDSRLLLSFLLFFFLLLLGEEPAGRGGGVCVLFSDPVSVSLGSCRSLARSVNHERESERAR